MPKNDKLVEMERKKRVVVIDDEQDVLTFMETLLRENGYDVYTAQDARGGMVLVKNKRPDLICLDLLMPEKTGIMLYRELRTDPQTKDIPVIMITGFTAPDYPLIDFKRFISKRSIPPPEGYMEKPIDKLALLKNINDILKGRLSDSTM